MIDQSNENKDNTEITETKVDKQNLINKNTEVPKEKSDQNTGDSNFELDTSDNESTDSLQDFKIERKIGSGSFGKV